MREASVEPNFPTLGAFLTVVLLGGGNGVAVRISNHELAPLWGATLRFALAAAVLLVVVLLGRVPLPRGAALIGSLLYGLLGFAAAFGLIYWALVTTPAGVGQVILALVPLLTLLLAVAQGLERFRLQALAGAIVALVGIGTIFLQAVGGGLAPLRPLALGAAAACMAASNIVVKRFPKCHPVANNAIAMLLATLLLSAASLLAGERWALPHDTRTWSAVLYVSLAGTVAVFSLYLFLIRRWSASATSYVMLLMPIVTVLLAALINGEPLSTRLVVGGGLVLLGVYLGAFAAPVDRRSRPRPAPMPRALESHPGCA